MLDRIDVVRLVEEPMPDNAWLLDGVFGQGQTIILAGPPGAGKSLFSYSLAYSVALGRTFLGREVRQGPVLYFDEENSLWDFKLYNQWIWRGFGAPDLRPEAEKFGLVHKRLPVDWYKEMLDMARAVKPVFICIDTTTSALSIKDENDNAEAARACKLLEHVRQAGAEQCTLMLLKHQRERSKDQPQAAIRGAKGWVGSTDQTVFFEQRGKVNPITGWYNTRLAPGTKVRALGLRTPLLLTPVLNGPDETLAVRLEVEGEQEYLRRLERERKQRYRTKQQTRERTEEEQEHLRRLERERKQRYRDKRRGAGAETEECPEPEETT